MSTLLKSPLLIGGWREWIALPGLGIERIKAKLDTGARTSALHAYNMQPVSIDGVQHVRFSVHPIQRHRHPAVACQAPLVDERVITSSSGKPEHRYVIETLLRLGDEEWPIEVSLTNRDEMSFRMLLGRQALRRRILVDPGSSYRLSRALRPFRKKRPTFSSKEKAQ